MKKIITMLCAVTMLTATAIPAFAAEAIYPTSVEEYMQGEDSRIRKTYQLSRTDDPAAIPTVDFERSGMSYTLLDITKTDEIGVDTLMHTESVTQSCESNNRDTVLSQLASEIEVTTQDEYSGTLLLDADSVDITTDGYATGSRDHSATRTYPNLSTADLDLIPKTVEEDGDTLNLADVQWEETSSIDGTGSPIIRYTAQASYSGTSSYQYATGYTVTVDYTGEVVKTDTEIVVYTAIFGGTASPTMPEPLPTPDVIVQEAIPQADHTISIIASGAALLLIAGVAVWVVKTKRGGKQT